MSPDRKFIPRHPPRLLDRLLSHWAEIMFGVLAFKQGAIALVDWRYGEPGALGFTEFQAGTLATVMISGALLYIFALLYRFGTLGAFLFWQRASLVLIVVGWGVHMTAPWSIRGPGASAWSTSVVGFVTAAGLLILTVVYERRIGQQKQGVE